VVSLLLHTEIFSVYLSATSGNRASETVIKVKRKPTSGLKHIVRNSMRVTQMRQGAISINMGINLRGIIVLSFIGTERTDRPIIVQDKA
jgi:hypothetical protein